MSIVFQEKLEIVLIRLRNVFQHICQCVGAKGRASIPMSDNGHIDANVYKVDDTKSI